jgi:hypothetical protein
MWFLLWIDCIENFWYCLYNSSIFYGFRYKLNAKGQKVQNSKKIVKKMFKFWKSTHFDPFHSINIMTCIFSESTFHQEFIKKKTPIKNRWTINVPWTNTENTLSFLFFMHNYFKCDNHIHTTTSMLWQYYAMGMASLSSVCRYNGFCSITFVLFDRSF